MKWYEVDLSRLVIRGLEKVGLAWNVVQISEERQAAKLVGATPAPAPAAQEKETPVAA